MNDVNVDIFFLPTRQGNCHFSGDYIILVAEVAANSAR